jgi:hypothetical protein
MARLLGKAEMRVDRNETVAGVPLIKVRDLMRRMCKPNVPELMRVSREGVAECTGADITDALVEAGFLTVCHEPDRAGYTITELGITLSCASFIKRISRAKANAIVKKMLCRAGAINANSDLIYRVAELRAFGSFITDAADLGDIDVAVDLQFKMEKGDLIEANKARARRSGRNSMSVIERCSFGWHEVCRLLKARSPYISFQPMDDVKQLGCETKLLYLCETTPQQ